MVSVTLSVPEEIHELMKKFPEVNWSGLVRQCVAEKAKSLAIKEELLKQLNKDKTFNEWAVNIVRKGRKD